MRVLTRGYARIDRELFRGLIHDWPSLQRELQVRGSLADSHFARDARIVASL